MIFVKWKLSAPFLNRKLDEENGFSEKVTDTSNKFRLRRTWNHCLRQRNRIVHDPAGIKFIAILV
jgi:hypothetical protein